MKLYIIGHVASGKTTLAREISARLGVPCFHLDEIVYMPDGSSPLGNRKRTPEDRDALFCEIISRHDWIIEDVGRECFSRGLLEADEVVLLNVPRIVLKSRIVRRFIRQKFGLERAGYAAADVGLGRVIRLCRG